MGIVGGRPTAPIFPLQTKLRMYMRSSRELISRKACDRRAYIPATGTRLTYDRSARGIGTSANCPSAWRT